MWVKKSATAIKNNFSVAPTCVKASRTQPSGIHIELKGKPENNLRNGGCQLKSPHMRAKRIRRHKSHHPPLAALLAVQAEKQNRRGADDAEAAQQGLIGGVVGGTVGNIKGKQQQQRGY